MLKKSFENQNILDLERFKKLKSITEYGFKEHNINFLYLPQNIVEITKMDTNHMQNLSYLILE